MEASIKLEKKKNKLSLRKTWSNHGIKLGRVSGIKKKMIVMLIIFITVPSMIIGYYSNKSSSTAIQNLVEEKLTETASDKQIILEQMLSGVSVFGKTLSRDFEIIESIDENSVRRIWLFRYLKNIREDNKAIIESLVIVDQNGQSIVTSDNVSADINLGDRLYMKQVLEMGKESRSTIITSRLSGKPTIAIAHPIIENDSVKGAIVATVNFDMLTKEINAINLGEWGYSVLLDSKGVIAYHPDGQLVMKNINEVNIHSSQMEIFKKMVTGAGGSGYYAENNEKMYTQYVGNETFSIGLNVNYKEYMSVSKGINNMVTIIIVISVIFSIISAYILVNYNIVKPLLQLKKLMTKAGQGDLRTKLVIKTGDEIQELGEIYNSMVDNQALIIRGIRENALELSGASQTLYAYSEEIETITTDIEERIVKVADHASHENHELNCTMDIIEALDIKIKDVAEFTANAERHALETKRHANRGREKVNNAVNAIKAIKHSSDGIQYVLNELAETSSKVNGIVNTINGISSQTNLLALNANIEAARAGESGRGFAVVADEIRKLSDQTGVEAKGISQLVKEINRVIEESLESMEMTTKEIVKGEEIVNDTDRTLLKILNAVNSISLDTSKLAIATQEETKNSAVIFGKIQDSLESLSNMKENSKLVALASSEQKAMITDIGVKTGETSNMSLQMLKVVEGFKI